MPGFNQTGPDGQGSMTGRKMGKCTNKDVQNLYDENDLGQGRGLGRGRGLGKGQGKGLGKGLGRKNRNSI